MDCKIIHRLFFLIILFTTTQLTAVEFKGKFLQGHYIIGLTDPTAQIIIEKKEVKVSKNGYFVLDSMNVKFRSKTKPFKNLFFRYRKFV